MKSIFKIQIVIIHLWFIVCSYLMLTENNEVDYIGKNEPTKTELYEILFYISLVILIVFYLYLLSIKLLNKTK
ncbi:hypothetical protein DFQ10_108139 [Winogradskyella eximia]|uniref:Uncharacterized protein n=1 Tax=Winogradskyella eximia TaxID=262006 RepID=A0A3D9GZQ2_9FLAO|nr:hypothetical protein DFQ10_108139 [Winogradskyella eximia]